MGQPACPHARLLPAPQGSEHTELPSPAHQGQAVKKQLAEDIGDTSLGSSLQLCSEGQDNLHHQDTHSYKRCQLWGHRERFGTRDGVRDDEVGFGCRQRAGHDGAIAAGSHLLHQLDSAVWDLVGI